MTTKTQFGQRASVEELRNRRNSKSLRAQPSWAEGRDAVAGETFIMAGTERERGDDLYLYGFGGQAEADLVDLMAELRDSIGPLVPEVVARRTGIFPSEALSQFDRLAELSTTCADPAWRLVRTGTDSYSGLAVSPELAVIDTGREQFAITSCDGSAPEELSSFIVQARNAPPALSAEVRST